MKIRRLLFATGVIVIALTGCGGKDKENNTKNDSKLETTKNVSENEEYVDCFNVQEAAASLLVNDQPMSFPIDVTGLKESITFGGINQMNRPHLYSCMMIDDTVDIGAVNMYSESDKPEEDGFVYFFEVKEGSPWNVNIKGITFGASIDEVKAAIGTPIFENGNVEETYRVYYENCSYEFLGFVFEGGALKIISFEYLPQEWRQ